MLAQPALLAPSAPCSGGLSAPSGLVSFGHLPRWERGRGGGYDGRMQQQTKYRPGMRVRVTQQMPRLTGALAATVEGTILRAFQGKTGSWYAHAKDDRLWLDRLELLKDDGEVVVLNLDRYSRVDEL